MSGSPHLQRVVGVPGVACTAFNGIVGVGIFSMPGLVAGLLGPAAIVAYLRRWQARSQHSRGLIWWGAFAMGGVV